MMVHSGFLFAHRFTEDSGVNKAWNKGVEMAKGEYVFIINNDIVLTKNIDQVLMGLLGSAKIACPFTTEGRYKFNLPVKKKEEDIAGWCFMMKKEDWKPIDARLDIWYGDTFQYYYHNQSVAWGGLIHHYVSKTLKSPEQRDSIQKRINKDKLAWEVIKDEYNFQKNA
jgi:glycosyltransferase involved in cell wall biosynthesis